MEISVSYSALSNILIDESEEAFFAFIKETYHLTDDNFESYRRQINQFVINHNFRWNKKSRRRRTHFNKQYASWLQQKFVLKSPQKKKELKPIGQCSVRTKKRRLAMVTQEEKDIEPGSSVPSKVQKKDDTEPTSSD